MASANLFQQYLQPVRSVQDYAADMDKAEANQLALQGQRRQNEIAALTADQTRQTMASSAEDRNALQRLAATWGADTSIDQRVASLRNSGRPALMQQADALEKQGLEKQKTGAEVSAKNADAIASAIKNSRTWLDGISTPEQYIAWHEANHRDPALGPYLEARGITADQARANIEQALKTPGGFERMLMESKLGAEKTYDNLMKQREFDLKAKNELIGPDGKVNTALLGAKQQVAKAGAPVQSSVTYQVDGQGNLVALPTKIPSGSGSVSSVPVMSGGQPVQGVGKDKPLPEAAQKQVMGARNLQDAVGGYLAKLQGWSNAKMLSPDQRADMGNAYNNMMLQAKEAYNLGVLNGPDYDILQSVVKDPTKLTSVLTSNEALSDQAKSLRNIAANIEKTALEAHGKKYTPRQTSNLSAQDQQAADWANANPNDPRAAQIKKRLGL